MSVVDLHDWRFRKDGDLEEGVAAIREYVDYLKEGEPGMQLSLWLRDQEDPLRYFHVAVYQDHAALERARRSEGTARFVDRLYPEIDEETHTAPECDVILSSWAGIQPEDRGITRGRLTPKAGGASFDIHDRYVMLLRRGAEGDWRIARLVWNPVPAGVER